jgi:choline kinase
MMDKELNYQEYYEAAYERLIDSSVHFYALDIAWLKWVEIDSQEGFATARQIFSQ